MRIDQQLRGRAGRQGDPGSSRFFVSLEDGLIRRFGVERLVATRIAASHERTPIENPWIRREIARAQRVVEGQDFDIRKTLHDYSELLERQRRYMARWRETVLCEDAGALFLEQECPGPFRRLNEAIGAERLCEVSRRISLHLIDRGWSEHLAHMTEIRTGIHLVRGAGRQPIDEFHRQSGAAFESGVQRTEREIVAEFESIAVTPDGNRSRPGRPARPVVDLDLHRQRQSVRGQPAGQHGP